MAYFDDIIFNKYYSNFKGYRGNPPESKEEYAAMDIWTDKTIAPTWEEISIGIENQKVKEARKKQYPDIKDQLDMLWHAIDTNSLNKTSDFYTSLKTVKDNNPYSGD